MKEKRNKPIESAHIIVFRQGKVLLVRHGVASGHITGVYGLPGGRMNPHEDKTSAVVREFKEETGYQLKKQDLISYPQNQYTADIERKDEGLKRFTMTVFLAKKFQGSLQGTDETKPQWIKIDDLNSYHLLPNVEKAIKDSLAVIK